MSPLSADGGDGDGSRFAMLLRQVDVVAPQGGGREALQFEKNGAELEVGVLWFEAALQQRKCGIERRESERGASLDRFGPHRGGDGDPVQRIRIRRAGIAEDFGIRHARSRWGLIGSVGKRGRQTLASVRRRAARLDLRLLAKRCRR